MYDYIVKFKNGLPSTNVILENLKEQTGLEIKQTSKGSFEHSMFGKVLTFECEDNSIVFFTPADRIFYLLGAALWVLKDMGGEIEDEDYYGGLPLWAKLPWKEARLHSNIIC